MSTPESTTAPGTIPSETALRTGEPSPAADTASVGETARIAATVLAPAIGAGLIKRRPAAMQLVERWELDRAAITTLRRVRRAHHGRPVRLRLPGRSITVLLDPTDAGHMLAGAPTPFSPATWEKRAALRRFQPHGVLISQGGERAQRRTINEEALEPGRELHHLTAHWTGPINAGAADLPALVRWQDFSTAWWRIVRQLTLGGDTAEDREVTELLDTLRQQANWSYLLPEPRRRRSRFRSLVHRQVALNRPGSLASALGTRACDTGAEGREGADDVAEQVPHWLFAFDAAGIATFRALALIASHPHVRTRAIREAADGAGDEVRQLPFLRACVLESLRLWPTTPALLREARTDTGWGRRGAALLAFTPLFHRDSARVPHADRFEPDIWLDGTATAQPALVPFSAGPAACPGRDVVLFTTATLLAAILRQRTPELARTGGARLDSGRIPASVNHFALTLST